MNFNNFLYFVLLGSLALYIPCFFYKEDSAQEGIDYWSSNQPLGRLVWLGFPIFSISLVITLIIFAPRVDLIVTSLVFWTSLFAMFTGVYPLWKGNKYFVFVYNRRKALWVGLLQFIVACLMVCSIILIESGTFSQ